MTFLTGQLTSFDEMGYENENIIKPHGQGANPEIALIFSIVSLFVAFFFLIRVSFLAWCGAAAFERNTFLADYPFADKSNCNMNGLWWATLIFLMANIMFVSYSNQLMQRNRQDYYGAMRTTGYQTNYQTPAPTVEQYRQNGKTKMRYKRYFRVELELEWGNAWACGQHDADRQCESLYQPPQPEQFVACSREECTDAEIETA